MNDDKLYIISNSNKIFFNTKQIFIESLDNFKYDSLELVGVEIITCMTKLDDAVTIKIGKIKYENFIDKKTLMGYDYFKKLFDIEKNVNEIKFEMIDMDFKSSLLFIQNLKTKNIKISHKINKPMELFKLCNFICENEMFFNMMISIGFLIETFEFDRNNDIDNDMFEIIIDHLMDKHIDEINTLFKLRGNDTSTRFFGSILCKLYESCKIKIIK